MARSAVRGTFSPTGPSQPAASVSSIQTLGCIASALPPPTKTKSVRDSRPAAMKPQATRNHLHCGAQLAHSTSSKSALSHLGTDQSASTNPEAWCAGVGRKLQACKSRVQIVHALNGTVLSTCASVTPTASRRLSQRQAAHHIVPACCATHSFGRPLGRPSRCGAAIMCARPKPPICLPH